MADEKILYDLLVPIEWPTVTQPLPFEELSSLWKAAATLIKGCWSVFQKIVTYPLSGGQDGRLLSAAVVTAISSRIPWQLCLNHLGDHLAVVKHDCIEIWFIQDGDKDNISLLGKCTIMRDLKPQWRKICWSTEDTHLAVGNSNGEIFLVGRNGFLVGRYRDDLGETTDLGSAYAGLCFVPAATYGKEAGHGDVLLSVTFKGVLTCFQVGDQCRELHSFSFSKEYPCGVGAFLYHAQFKTLVVAGLRSDEGISCWRILDASPHYVSTSNNTNQRVSAKYFRRLRMKRQGKNSVFHLTLSPNGRSLFAIEEEGQLSVWELPSCRMRRRWTMEEQPQCTLSVDSNSAASKRKGQRVPLDASWWNEKLVIVAYSHGDVVIVDTTVDVQLEDHLDNGPEVCQPGCVVTNAVNGGCFILESESSVQSMPTSLPSLEGEETTDGDEEHEVTESPGRTAVQLLKQVLYYVTDAERFRPLQKAAKSISYKHQLLAIQSTTCEELYERRIQMQEYDQALLLARQYNLDTGVVYQKQWETAPISQESIENYLTKISNIHWVLNECTTKVPPTYSAAKELLQYGLTLANLSKLRQMQSSRSDGFAPLEDDSDEESDDEEGQEEIKVEILRWGTLSEEQIFLCQFRFKLLQLKDKLECYERILGGPHQASQRYNSEEFRRFREDNLTQVALNCARSNDADAIGILFTLFGDVLLPHWLPILSNFPETTAPAKYRVLLPSICDGVPVQWSQQSLRKLDWCEMPEVMNYYKCTEVDLQQENSGDFLYEENEEWLNFKGELSEEMLTLWYSSRAEQIDSLSGQTNLALELIEFGIQRGVSGLNTIHHELLTMYTLVYQCEVDPNLSLGMMRRMTNLEKVQAMMRKVELEDVSVVFADHVIPFLQRLEAVVKGCKAQILEDYLLSVAKGDLQLCYQIIRLLAKQNAHIKMEVSELILVSIQCIFTSERSDQYVTVYKILDCLPNRRPSDSEMLADLHDQLDEIRDLLVVADKLVTMSVKKPLNYLKRIVSEPENVKQLLTQFTRSAGRRKPLPTESDWKNLLSDLLQMQKTVFTCLDEHICYKMLAEALLCNGTITDINLAAQLLDIPSAQRRSLKDSPSIIKRSFSYKLSRKESNELVLSAVKEYINSAAHCKDKEMDLAKECLQLLGSSSREAVAEANFIKALELLKSLGVEALPLKVRMCEDKVEIITELLKANPSAYKQHKKVAEVASLFGLDVDKYDNESDISVGMGKTLALLARVALDQNDFKCALLLCQDLVKKRSKEGWLICRDVAMTSNVKDAKARLELLEFASLHCPADDLEDLLQARNILEIDVLCNEKSNASRSLKVQRIIGKGAEKVEQLWSQSSDKMQYFMSHSPSWSQAVSFVKSAATVLPTLRNSSSTNEDPQSTGKETGQHFSSEESQVEGSSPQQVDLQIIVHPFYLSDLKEFQKYYLTGHYLDIESGMSEAQTSFRALSIAAKREEEDVTYNPTDVLLNLAREALTKDASLSLMYLLALPDPLRAVELFDHLRPSPCSLHFVLYYFSLLINSKLDVVKDHIFMCGSQALIATVSEQAMSYDTSNLSSEVTKLVQLFRKYHKWKKDFEEAESLLAVGLDVDVSRFTQEDEYQREAILQLAKESLDSSPSDSLQLALSLALPHGISEWLVYATHLQWLLCNSKFPTRKIEQRITQLHLRDKILSNPEECFIFLSEEIYPKMDGTQFGNLSVYYNLLKACADKLEGPQSMKEGSTLTPEVHLKILHKLRPCLQGVDYKKLMSGGDPLELVAPALSVTNVHVLAKLASKIPVRTGGPLKASDVYRCFALCLFWKVDEGPSQEADWIKRYQECHDYINRMAAEDLLLFAENVAISTKALQISRNTRIELLMLILSYLQAQHKESQKIISSVASLLEYLQELSRHEDELSLLPETLRIEFEQSVSSEEALRANIEKALLQGVALNIVDLMMACSRSVHLHPFTLEEVLLDTISHTLQNASLHEENLAQIERMCLSAKHYDNREIMLKVVKTLMPFTEDKLQEKVAKLSILSVLRKNFSSDVVDSSLLLAQQTSLLTEQDFETQISMESLLSEESRKELFESLLLECNSIEKLQSLAEVLKVWPNSTENRVLWQVLLVTLLKYPRGNELVLLLAVEIESLPEEVDKRLIQELTACGQQVAFKYALIRGTTPLLDFVVENMIQLDQALVESICNGTILELLVLRKIISDVITNQAVHKILVKHCSSPLEVDTLLFSKLLKCDESQVMTILSLDKLKDHAESIAKQLHEAGYQKEARSLCAEGRPLASNLTTAYSYMSKWFQH